MNSFTLAQLQIVADTYARYIGVRKVNVHLVKTASKFKRRMGNAYGYASVNPRKLFIIPKVLTLSRQAQLALIIHELCHFRRGGMDHAKSWKEAVALWGSIFQMRYVRTNEQVRRHIAEGCAGLDTYSMCDDCKDKSVIITATLNN